MASKKQVNLRELSKILQISQPTIRDWILKGCPAERTSKGFLFVPDEVFSWREKYLSEKKQSSEGYERARTERMIWLAKQAELNYKKQEGILVDAGEVKQAAFETARQVRDGLLNIPNRISDLLVGEINSAGRIDGAKVKEILDKELRQALEALSDNLNKSTEVHDDKN
ncbi:MAG: hypothetical protein DYG83_13260 [Candidatus Brocadia sp. AMX2]|uniref:Uncharacterized protein n=1 Tax=Candidatus Brocadia sinica JPN1 TaxID=1197129 RepID=A0ABQ0JYX6_9BACT|nr:MULTISPECIES: hypothetical protein [Brocadia]MBC6932215.1 hypothetical protein [Candidatus Brocadia sp.]MBL1168487.1 hypothetical protein [Candidatus Brocadia sp. AMX1]NOG40229.1 hypothetical protein [Planctomycetota bacterium]NUQ57683.1 hypothetical protein [Candidatus Paceibacter sp.]GIK14211.1 MAG: hypothetical protein BroJett002_29180 [Candidatus Brocadia sinica]